MDSDPEAGIEVEATAAAAKRLIAAAAVVITFGSSGPAAAEMAPGRDPVRSGSILGGQFRMAQDGPDCSQTPDCRAWLETDCDPDSPLISDPALFTSIVDVSDLVGLPKRRILRVVPSDGLSIPFGGLTVEFWDKSCVEIHPLTSPAQLTAEVGRRLKFKIPAGAEWMTLASWDVLRVDWTLR